MAEVVGIWCVEQEGTSYVVYAGETRLSVHPTLADAEEWMHARYWQVLEQLREWSRDDGED